MPAFHAAHPEIVIHLVAAGGPVVLGSGIDLAIRRSDFPLPPDMRAAPLFDERIGPVCRTDMIDRFFGPLNGTPTLRSDAPLLHTRTRPRAWATWEEASGTALSDAPSQTFEHFYLSLQAASAGIGVAIGPWQMVRDEIASGLLAAPAGFIADGSRYLLLSPRTSAARIAASSEALLSWLLDMA